MRNALLVSLCIAVAGMAAEPEPLAPEAVATFRVMFIKAQSSEIQAKSQRVAALEALVAFVATGEGGDRSSGLMAASIAEAEKAKEAFRSLRVWMTAQAGGRTDCSLSVPDAKWSCAGGS